MLKYTTLCYIEQDGKYLMLYRNKRKEDVNAGKWIGIGGHLEEGETPEECLVREALEETGLKLKDFKLRGKLHFHMDDIFEISYLYTCNSFEGELIECNEGELQWISKNQILDLPLWKGDYLFLNKLLEEEDFFEMKLVYKNDELIEWSIL
ncbi:MAG: 8-oxo-dGTP diphosphatase [Anaeroplasmataceae bacterium]|nr:8-oxo-dGTP diphosphatase [Anaeroplasmataceae bacterium]